MGDLPNIGGDLNRYIRLASGELVRDDNLDYSATADIDLSIRLQNTDSSSYLFETKASHATAIFAFE